MNGTQELARKSKNARLGHFIPVYYDFVNNTVYDTPDTNRILLTNLIKENTPEEIEQAVNHYMSIY